MLSLKSLYAPFDVREIVLNGFNSKIFPLQPIEGTGMSAHIAKVSDCAHPSDIAHVAKVSDHLNFKILSPKQMLQRLPIAFP